MAVQFKKAVKAQTTLRAGLIGPAGSGKTWTALEMAKAISERIGKPIAVIDSEHGSAAKYADVFAFDHLALESFAPERYVEAIDAAIAGGYGVVVVDSLSHAWAGKDGILEFVDREKRKSDRGDGYNAWGKATPKHNALVDKILACEGKVHLICTLRSKMEYVKEDDPSRPGKTRIRKVGMQPIQRDGLEYEFDLVGDLDQSNTLTVTKSRCRFVPPETVIEKPGKALAETVLDWLLSGEKVEAKPVETKREEEEGPRPNSPEDLGARVETVGEEERKAIVAAARERKMKRAEFEALLKSVAGVTDSSAIPASKAGDVKAAVEAFGVAA